MIVALLLAVLVAGGCGAASLRRLSFAVAPTAFDPKVMLGALRGDGARRKLARLERAAELEPTADWERDLFAAVRAEPESRAGLVNESLTELDHRMKRWARVPRVCASIASSAAFLLASMALRAGLTAATAQDDVTSDAINAAVISAIDVAAIGLAGAAICIAAQMRATRAAKDRAEAADKLVERLERLLQR